MNREQVIKRVLEEIKRRGTVTGLAKDWGVSRAYLNDVIFSRRTPGPKILVALGLRKVIKPTLYVEDV